MRVEAIELKVDGHDFCLRNAEEADAEMLISYLKTTCGETRYLIKEPEEITMTLEQERKFINTQNEADHSLMLLGFLDGEYVGNCSFMGMGPSRYLHRASMGIALFQKYTGRGLGKVMVSQLCDIARASGIDQLELEVVTDNVRAVSLYIRQGFKACGILPDNMKYKDGTYADVYYMVKKL